VVTVRGEGITRGSQLVFQERIWKVERIEGDRLLLEALTGRASANPTIHTLMADPSFRVVFPEPEAILSDVLESADLTRIPSKDMHRAVRLGRHLEEIARGLPFLEDETPPYGYKIVAAYEPGKTMSSKLRAKATELRGTDLAMSERQLERYMRRFKHFKLLGLLPQNSIARQVRQRRIDVRYYAVMASQILAETNGAERGQTEILAATNRLISGNDEYAGIEIPSTSTQKRIFNVLKRRIGWRLGRRKYVQSAQNRPGPTYLPVRPMVPGERAEIDTKTLNIRVRDPVTGARLRPFITVLICVATRMVLGMVIGFVDDHTVMPRVILDALTPKPPILVRELKSYVNRLGVAPELLFELYPDLDPNAWFASGPLVMVRVVVIDQGKPFFNRQGLLMLHRVGIACELARKGTPTDKPHIERFFGTLESLIKQLKGYTGIDVAALGKSKELEPDEYLTLGELETYIRAWIAVHYHQRPHSSLHVPVSGGATMTVSPMEMYQLLVEQHGFIPAPLGANLRYLLMDVEPLTIQRDGIHLKGLYYDSQALDHIRMSDCAWTHDGKWRVHFDPMDCRQVYLEVPEFSRRVWVEIPWVHQPPEMMFPFPMRAIEFIKRHEPVLASDGSVTDWKRASGARPTQEETAERAIDFVAWTSIFLSGSIDLDAKATSQRVHAVRAWLDAVDGTRLRKLEQRYLAGANQQSVEPGATSGGSNLSVAEAPETQHVVTRVALDPLDAWRLLSGDPDGEEPGDA